MKVKQASGWIAAALVLGIVTATPGRAADGLDANPTGTAAAAGGEAGAHAGLAALAGAYDLTSRFWPEPGAEAIVSHLPARRELALDGRALRLDVGPDAGGFRGTGLSGYDQEAGRFWYVWSDTSTTGVSILHGTLRPDGGGSFAGETPTPYGRSPLRIEIRTEDGREIHDYFVPAEGGESRRLLELTYERRR